MQCTPSPVRTVIRRFDAKTRMGGPRMSRRGITGKGPIVKNNTATLTEDEGVDVAEYLKRRLYSDALGTFVTLRIATRTIRSIEHVGGLDRFILSQPTDSLSKRARTLQSRIRKTRVQG